jgi:hypothetical protein
VHQLQLRQSVVTQGKLLQLECACASMLVLGCEVWANFLARVRGSNTKRIWPKRPIRARAQPPTFDLLTRCHCLCMGESTCWSHAAAGRGSSILFSDFLLVQQTREIAHRWWTWSSSSSREHTLHVFTDASWWKSCRAIHRLGMAWFGMILIIISENENNYLNPPFTSIWFGFSF